MRKENLSNIMWVASTGLALSSIIYLFGCQVDDTDVGNAYGGSRASLNLSPTQVASLTPPPYYYDGGAFSNKTASGTYTPIFLNTSAKPSTDSQAVDPKTTRKIARCNKIQIGNLYITSDNNHFYLTQQAEKASTFFLTPTGVGYMPVDLSTSKFLTTSTHDNSITQGSTANLAHEWKTYGPTKDNQWYLLSSNKSQWLTLNNQTLQTHSDFTKALPITFIATTSKESVCTMP